MTKKRRVIFFLTIILISLGFFLLRLAKDSKPESSTTEIKSGPLKRSIFIRSSSSPKSPQAQPKNDNPPPPWEDQLIENLKAQAGDELEKIDYVVFERRSWPVNEIKIPVALTTLKLTRKGGMETKVDVMIDETTGKILQSWNAPVIDPVNPREEFRIKLPNHSRDSTSQD